MPTNDEIIEKLPSSIFISNSSFRYRAIKEALNFARADEREQINKNRIVSNAIVLEGKPIPKRKGELYLEKKIATQIFKELDNELTFEETSNHNNGEEYDYPHYWICKESYLALKKKYKVD